MAYGLWRVFAGDNFTPLPKHTAQALLEHVSA
jgi:hypothetical protein